MIVKSYCESKHVQLWIVSYFHWENFLWKEETKVDLPMGTINAELSIWCCDFFMVVFFANMYLYITHSYYLSHINQFTMTSCNLSWSVGRDNDFCNIQCSIRPVKISTACYDQPFTSCHSMHMYLNGITSFLSFFK